MNVDAQRERLAQTTLWIHVCTHMRTHISLKFFTYIQYGSKVHGSSNRRGLGINRSTQFGHLCVLSVRARICASNFNIYHISRGAAARAKQIPGTHTRSSDLRDARWRGGKWKALINAVMLVYMYAGMTLTAMVSAAVSGFRNHRPRRVALFNIYVAAKSDIRLPVRNFVWNEKLHIPNGTAKSVGSHSVSNIRYHGISVEDCDQTEILVTKINFIGS